MKIKVNGEEKEITGEINITTLLKENDVEQPDMVSVQLNGEFVERDVFESTSVKENDEVEFLYFMGGGVN
ncbi:MAG: thiamine biosynthesis protein ThiS [Planctomycetota bacterium]|nr:MAG: thiamine biosynthesis protein ThiS [Planctomycetota bacterium]